MQWIALLIVVLVLFLGFSQSEEEITIPLATPAAPAATATPASTPAQPNPPAPAPAAQPAIDPNLIPRMQQVAQRTGVQVTSVQPVQPGSAWISIAFRSDNKTLGADFIEALLNQGIIKDFDDSNTYPNSDVQNGTVINTNKFLVRF